MKIKSEVVHALISQIDSLLTELEENEKKAELQIQAVAKGYAKSARNLIHYTTLRSHDIRDLQKQLKNVGLSRFANAGSHVKASLLATKYILESLVGQPPVSQPKSGLSIKNGLKMQNRFAKELLGYRSKGRRVRIMVTQPTETAENYAMVLEMVRRGMNCARINCAHDNPDIWRSIIRNVKKAARELDRKVTIAMDLAGPKIRTGEIVPGPKVRKFSPERDDVGRIIRPAFIQLVPGEQEGLDELSIPVDGDWLERLAIDDHIQFSDTRSKNRKLKVVAVEEGGVTASCPDTSYIETGMRLVSAGKGSTEVGELPPLEQSILLRTGDVLTVRKEGQGAPAVFDDDGNLLEKARITCQVPEIFDRVSVGEPVLFDDGKIAGKIIAQQEESFEVEITRAKMPASKLKAEKGINFPVSDLRINGLTQKDRDDLRFVVEHADIVNFSFVNSPQDVEELFEVLKELDAFERINVILKIETQRAYDNLAAILLTAMKMKYVGVMIARGDLAVETGWDKIGWVQKEILGLCNAAHIPVVWATQVFENLAKKGLPSRAEITDATTSLKADCVMLNKGHYINYAISLLNRILIDMEKFDEKNESMLPTMGKLMDG